MRLHVADHPLVAHKLTVLRDKGTPSPTFRLLVDELVTLLAYEATRDVHVDTVEIETPVTTATGVKLADPRPLVVPILRAGLGMLDGMTRLLPTAEVGFLGMMRNEETLQASTYAERLPDDLAGRQCYVLDPMLATGGTLAAAIRFLTDRGADHITAICLLAAPEGCDRLEQELEGLGVPVTMVTAAMDEASKSAWCREHGVYPQELEQWRLAATQALADPGESRASPAETKADRRRIKELERELRRKDKALAEAAALLVLRKKLAAIYSTDKDEDA